MSNPIKSGLNINELLSNTPNNVAKNAISVRISNDIQLHPSSYADGAISILSTRTIENQRAHSQEVRVNKSRHFWVSCDCEYFMFNCEYALTQYGASEIKYSNGQPAVKRNPKNVPRVCKHLYKILSNRNIINSLYNFS